ncbi:glycoside hydrolase family 24 protein [Enterobacter sp. PTB]|uniref:glycoside hydrolase family 24 protein n=1 Tax=Enterobacter sp. PTB TaxID=3143437 RepID=UPI003DA8C4B5
MVKHESEWHGGSTNPKWKEVFATVSGDFLAYVKQWLDAHEWMSQVPEFSKDEAIWHFHPVEFLAAINTVTINLKIARLRAFMRMIRVGEGTTTALGYRTMFTGAIFDSFDEHPNQLHTANNISSTAAGAYQFLYRTWRSLKLKLQLSNFSPNNQDLACIELIYEDHALQLILDGEINESINLCESTWASLPGSPHGQPTQKLNNAILEYNKYLEEEQKGITSGKDHVTSVF